MTQIIIIASLSVSFSIIYQVFFGGLYRRNNLHVEINKRSSHKTKATATGGISIFLALFSTTLFFYFKSNQELFDYSILLPISLLFITGVIDDLQNIDFKIKLLLQIIAAKLIIDQGFVLDQFYGINGLIVPNYLFAQVLTGFLFISIINAINFIDGLDGLAIAFTLFILITVSIISSNNVLYPLNLILIFCLSIALYFNFNKKNKVFLGDAGSLFLGCIIAINIIHLLNPKVTINFGLDPNKFLLIGLIIFYPLMDLSRTVFFRVLAKKSPFKADKTHLHHLLLARTNSHFRSVLLLIIGCVIFLFLGIGLWTLFDEWGILFHLLFFSIVMLWKSKPN